MRRKIRFGAILLTLVGLSISYYGYWTHREVGNFVASADYIPEPSPFHPDNLVIKSILGFYSKDVQAGATVLTVAVAGLFFIGIFTTAWGLYNLFVRET